MTEAAQDGDIVCTRSAQVCQDHVKYIPLGGIEKPYVWGIT